MTKKGMTSTIVHAERHFKSEHGAIHKPIHVSSQYAYETADELVDAFRRYDSFTYSRQGTPTTAALESLITQLEEGTGTLSFSSGMAAISSTLYALLRAGDHLICSKYIFGNTKSLLGQLQQLGVEITFVDPCNMVEVEAALQDNSRMLFTETIANPGTQVAELAKMGDFCEKHNLVYFIDSTMNTPYLLKGKDIKASLVMHSLSKYFCGHANALGGSVTSTGLYDWTAYPNIYDDYKKPELDDWGLLQIKKKGLRDVGACMTSDAAHRILMGTETMILRLERCFANAQRLAEFLVKHPLVDKVSYPGMTCHPQHALATQLFGGRGFGGLLAVELNDAVDPLRLSDDLELPVMATHLGDNRTLILPAAKTIYYEMGPEGRQSMGIAEGLLRVSVGIEDIDDLIADFDSALSKQAG